MKRFKNFLPSNKLITVVTSDIFLVALTVLAISSVFSSLKPSRIILWPQNLTSTLTVVAVMSGGLVFWLNRESLETIGEEAKQEKPNGKERVAKFRRKFPWIALKVKHNYPYILMAIFVLALGLRAIDLNRLEPYTDEYSHLVSALGIVDHGSPTYNINGETRAPYVRFGIFTHSLALLFKNFDQSLTLARLPGIIFSALTIFPLFKLGSKISISTGLFSSLLSAISPWAIATSRNARELAFFPLSSAFIAILLYEFAKFLREFLSKNDRFLQPKHY